MNFRNLEAVRHIIKEATGLDITYAWEDLVFPENMAFLIGFDDWNTKNFYCFFHQDCYPEDRQKLLNSLTNVAANENFTLEFKGAFSLEQKGEEVDIRFH